MDARAFKSAHHLYEQGIPTKLGKQWKPMQVSRLIRGGSVMTLQEAVDGYMKWGTDWFGLLLSGDITELTLGQAALTLLVIGYFGFLTFSFLWLIAGKFMRLMRKARQFMR